MTDKEKIIAEIERLKAEAFNNIKNRSLVTDVANSQRIAICKQLLDFINSLPVEQPSEDLEEAANIYANKQGLELKPFARRFFIAGAHWQKEQIMKNCLYNTEVMLHTKQNNKEYLTLANDKLPHIPVSCGLNVGDKVKILIIKED